MGFTLSGVLAIAIISYFLAKVFYRVYLSPLAKIPGPKLAAAIQMYEIYYDLVQKARFPWQIENLHARYVQLSASPQTRSKSTIQNSRTYCFSSGSTPKLNKYEPHQHQFGMPESTFNTIDAELHKTRRGALNPFFSRRSINALEPTVIKIVEQTCSCLAGFKAAKSPIDLRLLFSCMTTDIVTDYAFPHCFGLLATEDLAPGWRMSFAEGLRNFQWFKHFPSLWSVLRSIPDHIMLKLAPQMAITQKWERDNQKLVRDIVDSYDARKEEKKEQQHATIFHELLSSTLPPREKSYQRLWQEGSALIGAGVETTSNTLCVALFHLSQHSDKLARLKEELATVMPIPDQLAPWATLEGLPYLSAVVKESLRLAYGTTSRFIRVAPDSALHYKDFVIPPGTAVSMTAMLLCKHPDLFDKPEAFEPERWLTKNRAADLFVFGRGPRMCAGQNLANVELYLAIAAIVRRFDWTLFETDMSDIEAICDAVMPLPKIDSKGGEDHGFLGFILA